MISLAWNETNWKPRFFTIWGGQAVSLFGSQLVQFALIWWLTQESGSATVLALASLAGLLPEVLLGPFAGTLVDRWKRRGVILVADSVIALATLVLAYLFAIDAVGVGTIYTLLLVRGIGSSFHWPAMAAATSLMVPKEQLTRVQGLNQMLQGILRIVAAPLGALLLSLVPMQGILMIDVGTALLAILPLVLISIPEVERSVINEQPGKPSSFWQEFRSGLLYVKGWPGLMILMLMAMLLNFLLTPASSLLPFLVSDYFGGQAIQLGWLQSAFGFGMVAGGLILGAWGGFKKRMLTSLLGLIGLGFGFLLIGFIPATLFWLAILGAFFAASMLPFVNGPFHAIVQAVIEPKMQGRVFTLMGSLSAAMSPLGLIIAGPVADAIGVQSWYMIGGAASILMAIFGFSLPAVMNIEDNHHKAPEPLQEPVEPGVSDGVTT
jgi:DHA3 family macrolide efflux protein-like MFS transporter